jgi:hypothetical protein
MMSASVIRMLLDLGVERDNITLNDFGGQAPYWCKYLIDFEKSGATKAAQNR